MSKSLVATAKDTGRGLAIEARGGMRDRVTARKLQRATLPRWSFVQWRSFVEYQATRLGVLGVPVDPRNTSRACPCCGHIDKAHRKTQDTCLCVDCGFSGLADDIAATNIRRRASVTTPNISTGPVVPA